MVQSYSRRQTLLAAGGSSHSHHPGLQLHGFAGASIDGAAHGRLCRRACLWLFRLPHRLSASAARHPAGGRLVAADSLAAAACQVRQNALESLAAGLRGPRGRLFCQPSPDVSISYLHRSRLDVTVGNLPTAPASTGRQRSPARNRRRRLLTMGNCFGIWGK